MKKNIHAKPTYNSMGFMALWTTDLLEPFFNIASLFSLIVTGVIFWIQTKVPQKLVGTFLTSHSESLLTTSVGSIGIILAAMAIAVVIFDKKSMHMIYEAGNGLEQFLFSYWVAAVLWAITALTSLFYLIFITIFPGNIIQYINYFYIFVFIYSISYTIRLIGDVIRMSLLAAKVTNRD